MTIGFVLKMKTRTKIANKALCNQITHIGKSISICGLCQKNESVDSHLIPKATYQTVAAKSKSNNPVLTLDDNEYNQGQTLFLRATLIYKHC